ncbi:hypothetical protein DFH06DRAFT_191995 [Mycena polygramma]|nr:hypothetical protein DFH06DRAFT_191995 [Mycena polygramma]
MHRCLTIPEIVAIICTDLCPSSPDFRRTLAALAITCQTFSGPALDCLWREQESVLPMLRCLPSTLVSIDRAGKWKFARPIQAVDWERPLVYARRVKALSLGPQQGDVSALRDILHLLSVCVPRGCLFPNLEQVLWNYWTRLLYIGMLLSPKLLGLTMLCTANSDNVSVLSTLADRCPSLKSLSISHPRRPGDQNYRNESYQTTSAAVCTLVGLESLTMGVPNVAALKHLAQLPSLKALHLNSIPVGFNPPPTALSTFPQLQALSILLTTGRYSPNNVQ